jgi:predicted Zn-dependent peptidase
MKLRQTQIHLAVLILCIAPLLGAAKVQIPITYYKLGNGLKVVISEDHIAPVVTVAVYYHTGFRIEPKGQTGFAHLFEHMMFEGSRNAPKGAFARFIESNGGGFNGHTDFDYTNYFEQLPSSRVETALWLEADRMQNLKITEENLANQKEVVMEEVRSNVLNQPYGLFQWIDLWMNANRNWYNAHNGYGDFTDLRAATTKMAEEFYQTYYAPNNAVLVVNGDVDTAAVRQMIEKYFASIPQRPLPKKPDVSEPPQTEEKMVSQKDKLAKIPAVAIGYHMPPQDSPDYPAMVLLNLILEGDESSRLYQKLVKEKQICLDWTGEINLYGNDFDYDGPMLLTMMGTYKPEFSAKDIVQSIDEVLAGIRENGISEKELSGAKVLLRSNFYDELENQVSRSHLLSVLALFRDQPQQINTILDPYLKVQHSELKAAASKYLIPANRTVIDRVPEQGGK